MTTDLITALQTHGQLHKGTDLGGVLQWAILHIQSQAEALEELRADFEEEHNERLRFEKAAHDAKAAIDAALAAIAEAMPAPPLDFATDHTSHINLMSGIGDPDYMKGSLSSRHIDLRETATGKPKKDKKPHEKNN
jgi:hypothetical protein